MYAMLKDSDARVRNEAANSILEFNMLQAFHPNHRIELYSKSYMVTEFVAETLSNEVPFSMDNPSGCLNGFQPGFGFDDNQDNAQMKRVLGRHLFDITNMLFDLKSNEQLVCSFTLLEICRILT